MTSDKNNQIRNRMIASHPKTDRVKLAGLERHIHENHPTWNVVIEPFLLFTKGEDNYMTWDDHLNETLVQNYTIHPPDLLIFTPKMIAVELDGTHHSDSPGRKDRDRNRRYKMNDIACIIINEEALKLKLGVTRLTQKQINQAFEEGIAQI